MGCVISQPKPQPLQVIHDGAKGAMLEVFFNGVPKQSMNGQAAGIGLVTLLGGSGLTLQGDP